MRMRNGRRQTRREYGGVWLGSEKKDRRGAADGSTISRTLETYRIDELRETFLPLSCSSPLIVKSFRQLGVDLLHPRSN